MVAEAEALAARVGDGDRDLALRALLLRGRLRRSAGDTDGAEALLDRVAREALTRDPDLAAEATLEWARATMVRGAYAEVQTRCAEATAMARSPKVRAAARALGGVAALYAGEAAQGTAMLEAARGEYASLALPREEATLLVYLAIGRERAGDLAGARSLHEQSLDRARAAGDLRAMVTARINLGHIAQRTGDLGAALEHNEAALTLARRAGIRTVVPTARLNLASQLLRIGSLDRARAELDAALALARDAGARDMVAAATLMLGVASARGGDTAAGARAHRRVGATVHRAGAARRRGRRAPRRGRGAARPRRDGRPRARRRARGARAERVRRPRGCATPAPRCSRPAWPSPAPTRAAALRLLGEVVPAAEKEGDWEVLAQSLAARALAHEATGAGPPRAARARARRRGARREGRAPAARPSQRVLERRAPRRAARPPRRFAPAASPR